MPNGQPIDEALHRYAEGRILSLRTTRYSWWVHAKELADFVLPRRYRWLITPNQMNRGSPINQHILDSTGTLAARNLSSGIMSGVSSPTRPWFRLKIGRIDSTRTSPISLWLADVERLAYLVCKESNFYDSVAQLYFDAVVFPAGVILIYEDFDNVINCFNPCFGEYYLALDGKFRPTTFGREFTMTVEAVVDEYGIDNVSETVKQLYNQADGSGKSKEIIVAHLIEPNTDPAKSGIPKEFEYYELYWEWGGSASPQNGGAARDRFLRKKGYYEQIVIPLLWDRTGNDPYGRSPAMDALPDIKQLQLESRRKAQGIDKGNNPPMVFDIQLKNQPASMLPGGATYVSGFSQTGNAGAAPIYGNWKPDIKAMSADLEEVRARVKTTFFNDVLQTMAQLRAQTSSNVTAAEVDATRAEALVLLGPVLNRIATALKLALERIFAVMSRANILPPAPPEIQGKAITIEFDSILAVAQAAAAAGGIERLLALAGNLAAVDPATTDGLDLDFILAKYGSLMRVDPRAIRSPEELIAIRKQRAQQQAMQQQAELAEKMAAGAKTLSETDIGGGRNVLEAAMGGGM